MVQECDPPPDPFAAACRPGPLEQALDPDLFQALGNTTRLKLLACLARCSRPCTVTELASCCDVDLSVVSRHLSRLEAVGVLLRVRDGRTVSYVVDYAAFSAQLRDLADLVDGCGEAGAGGCC